MADFCQQCSIEHFGEDTKDLANLMEADQYSDEYGAPVICEGCGFVVVDINGKCISQDCSLHGIKKEATNDKD